MTAFQNQTRKRQFASYKWARNNTLQILKAAQGQEKLATR